MGQRSTGWSVQIYARCGGQLTDADYSTQPDEDYAYDHNGNRTGTGLVIGDNNQVLSDGTYDYDYDAEGNLVLKTDISSGEYTEYTYDHRNRMTSATSYSSGGIILQDVEFTYDVFDRRIAKMVDADGAGSGLPETLYTVYDGQHAWADFDGSGNVLARYLFGDRIDEILARWQPVEGTAWYLTDHLGTVRDIVDDTGALVNTITYDSFGSLLSQTGPSAGDRFTYTGREYDAELGLYYYRARFYDPQLGRFVSEDPIGFAAGDANLYRYVGNNPIIRTDPTGMRELRVGEDEPRAIATIGHVSSPSLGGRGNLRVTALEGEARAIGTAIREHRNSLRGRGNLAALRASQDESQVITSIRRGNSRSIGGGGGTGNGGSGNGSRSGGWNCGTPFFQVDWPPIIPGSGTGGGGTRGGGGAGGGTGQPAGPNGGPKLGGGPNPGPGGGGPNPGPGGGAPNPGGGPNAGGRGMEVIGSVGFEAVAGQAIEALTPEEWIRREYPNVYGEENVSGPGSGGSDPFGTLREVANKANEVLDSWGLFGDMLQALGDTGAAGIDSLVEGARIANGALDNMGTFGDRLQGIGNGA